ncbi:50S ribosomal protein L1 [Candidatus Uhrbacteria bacterium CG_4_9_14_3_um_filter_36_7]|uniref:Large ribosomal subunit protein uL1 n=1 Tax=Candidatus Uhrbacteria bacterium CG_4_9_14_3_um_filter_36_7 TaxID=1975033 RepID=A0A2M7XIC6_9BACT|nr:MAG: 50S ribosomal protein L1 [Candidatus Uhrbacteria bacterium CG_4_9_14_3_um_filter_36_7]
MPSQRFIANKTPIEKKKTYPIEQAIALLKDMRSAKFDEAVEIHIRLGIDTKKSEQQVRGTLVLPHGTGKTKRVAAFVEAEKESEAKKAGAYLVGSEELIEEITKTGKIDFDVAVATPAMMPKMAKLAKLLGPRGLMPNPKTETIGSGIGKIIEEQKAGKISFKNDDTGNVHQVIGRLSFSQDQLKENLLLFMQILKKLRPSAAKGDFIRSATITSTMGPGIKIEISS